MRDRWIAEVRVWPVHHPDGRAEALKACGGEKHCVEVSGQTPDEALQQVKLFQDGLQKNPLVWQAPLYRLERLT